MFNKVSFVNPMSDYRLLVVFVAGDTKIYDVKPLFAKWPVFSSLKDIEGLFVQVQVDTGGYGISWNADIDLSCDELWENGISVDSPFRDILSFRDATNLWGLNESTLRKAVSYKKLVNGIDVRKYGKQWVVTRDAMLREYGEPKDTAGA